MFYFSHTHFLLRKPTHTHTYLGFYYSNCYFTLKSERCISCSLLYNKEKAMAPHPVLLPGKSHGRRSLVGCSPWVTKSRTWLNETWLSLLTFVHWTGKWQTTPVFLPGESQGWGSLVGCRLWGCTESDMTDVTDSSSSCIINYHTFSSLKPHLFIFSGSGIRSLSMT